LVARSLRTGCQDPQPAACRADPRADGDSLWRGGLDPGGNAPGRRSLTPQTAGAAPLYVHVPAAVAVCSHVPGGDRAGFRVSLGEHRDRRHLYHAEPDVPVAPASVSRRAEAGSSISTGDALHTTTLYTYDVL